MVGVGVASRKLLPVLTSDPVAAAGLRLQHANRLPSTTDQRS
jgi:hypothetical protein